MRHGATGALGAVAVFTATVAVAQTPAQPPRLPAHEGGGRGGHGTPPGWKFTWPKGDVAKGREAFARFECYRCHEVKGEKFPAPTEKGKVGPELSQMGPLHEPEYFAEAILNPNAVIEKVTARTQWRFRPA